MGLRGLGSKRLESGCWGGGLELEERGWSLEVRVWGQRSWSRVWGQRGWG